MKRDTSIQAHSARHGRGVACQNFRQYRQSPQFQESQTPRIDVFFGGGKGGWSAGAWETMSQKNSGCGRFLASFLERVVFPGTSALTVSLSSKVLGSAATLTIGRIWNNDWKPASLGGEAGGAGGSGLPNMHFECAP